MKIYLDDERAAPEGWTQARWPQDVVKLMHEFDVTHLSLDHDLGDDAHGTGYDVLLWIESRVSFTGFKIPEITIHTSNPAARLRMEAAVDAINRARQAVMSKPELPGIYMKHMGTSAPDCLINYEISFGKMTINLYVDFISHRLLLDFLEMIASRDERFVKTDIKGAINICSRFKVRVVLPSGTTFKVNA
jgi:hypothetical protein